MSPATPPCKRVYRYLIIYTKNWKNTSPSYCSSVFFLRFFWTRMPWGASGKLKPRHAPSSASRPGSRPVSRPAANSRATAAPETQKGDRISPAAKRFPPSPFREAVKPPLLVPVLRDGLGGDLCDGHPLGLRPGEDRFHDVGREVVQGKNSCDV